MGKFQRNYEIIVQDKDKIPVNITMPFTIEFNVERNPMCSNVIGTVRVFNLKEDTRNRLFKPYVNLTNYNEFNLRAGYGKDLHTILFGNVGRCTSKREGVNYITTFEVYSGQYAVVNSVTNKNVGKGLTKKDVIIELIRSLPSLKAPIVGNSFTGGFTSRDMALSGKTVDLIKELTGGQFFIDNEQPYAISEGESFEGIFNIINAEAGLLGSPQLEGIKLTFQMVFEPRILMFQILDLQASTEKQFNGQYKVVAFKHSGMISETVAGQAITEVTMLKPYEPISILTGYLQ